MLISHESPLCMLETSRFYNDYDYALVHLFDKYPEYYAFFKASLTMGREVILDNSIFELGTSFDHEKYADWINKLEPTFYIVPDVLEDSEGTIDSFNTFTARYSDLPGKKIGVVQGKTYEELVKCYQHMSEYADYIAISFDYSFYQTIGLSQHRGDTSADEEIRKLERFCDGRKKLIAILLEDRVWNCNKPHHLLGCSLAKEFAVYERYKRTGRYNLNIRSCDTSNPVVAGMRGQRYLKGIGLTTKPKDKLADIINEVVDLERGEDVLDNVGEFRYIATGSYFMPKYD